MHRKYLKASFLNMVVSDERVNLSLIGISLAMANVTIKVPQPIPAMMTAFNCFIRKSPSSLKLEFRLIIP
jgi:hypothetical protein